MATKRRRNNDFEEKGVVNEEEVVIDFEGCKIEPCNYDGIKQLLHQVFLRARINLSDLTNLLIEQNHVGTIIKQCYGDDDMEDDDEDDDEDYDQVFGVTSVVRLYGSNNRESVSQLKAFVLEKSSSDKKSCETIKKILENEEKNVGLLINERFVNISPKIAVPLFEKLVEELSASTFKVDVFMIISKLYKFKDEIGKLVDESFTNPEDEIFAEHALLTVDYSVEAECDTAVGEKDDVELFPFRRVMLFTANEFPLIISKIKSALE